MGMGQNYALELVAWMNGKGGGFFYFWEFTLQSYFI